MTHDMIDRAAATVGGGASPFDKIRQVRADGSEFWSARDLLMGEGGLGYTNWRNSEQAVKRAMKACRNSEHDPADHFVESIKVMQHGRWNQVTVKDYELSRYASYLVALNGDPDKVEVAAAQTYFTIQTRRAEVELALPATPVILPWSQRINDHVLLFRARIARKHPGWWAIVTETIPEMLAFEDALAIHFIPLKLTDQQDGSSGALWSHFREGKPWAGVRYHDVVLTTPSGKGPPILPYLYQDSERRYFWEWFLSIYVPEHFPEYLDNKVRRDKTKWIEQGLSVPPPANIGRASEYACKRLECKPPVLPQSIGRALRLEGSPRQQELFPL